MLSFSYQFTSQPVYSSTGCHFLILPARLRHARNFAVEREVPKTEAAHAEPAIIGAPASALHAAVILARGEFRLPLLFFSQSFSCHDGFLVSSEPDDTDANPRQDLFIAF